MHVYCHITEAVRCLEKEITPKPVKVGASVEYRKSVAIGLFYKVSIRFSRWFTCIAIILLFTTMDVQFYLAAIPDHLSQSVLSVVTLHVRPISHGQQCYTPNPSEFPVGKPMTKVTAKLQVVYMCKYDVCHALIDILILCMTMSFVCHACTYSVQGRQSSQLIFPP